MKLALVVILAAMLILVLAFQNVSLFYVGYLWASILYPSAFTEGYLNYISLPFLFGFFSLLSYVLVDKSNRAAYPAPFYLALLLALWVTITTMTATLPDVAWEKWKWAFQSILIAISVPIFLRTRAQLETGYIAVLTALSAHVITAGVKTFLGTGGYDRLGRLMMSNSWLGETSTLAIAAVLTIPMAWYAVRHSLIFENLRGRLLDCVLAGYAIAAILCVIGTSARTGILAMGACCLVGIRGIGRKILVVIAAAGIFFLAQDLFPQRSMARYQTIQSYQQDTSAETRIAVWRWAMGYTAVHPAGGGFGIFNESFFSYVIKGADGRESVISQKGRAPHSVYFEVLGEQGYPGIVLYLGMILGSIWSAFRISRKIPNDPERVWCADFARSLFICMVTFLVGGAFVGIAFQPLIYCFVGFSIAAYRLAFRKVAPARRPVLQNAY